MPCTHFTHPLSFKYLVCTDCWAHISTGILVIEDNVQYCYFIENCLSWNIVLCYLLSFKASQPSQNFFQVLTRQTAMVHWESLHIKCYATYTSTQPHAIYRVIFKTNLDPNTYYKSTSTTAQKLNNRMVLVKFSMSQPLISSRIYLFLLPA